MKKPFLVVLLLATILTFSIVSDSFAQRSTTKLTDNDYDEEWLRISNSGHIIWEGKPGGPSEDWEVFLHDGTSLIWNTDNSVPDNSSSVNDNGHVVWQRSDGNPVIFLYDGTGEANISSGANPGWAPSINTAGDIVWFEWTGAGGEIFFYDSGGAGITNISNNSYPDVNAQINDNGYITWLGAPDGSNYSFFLYDGASVIWQSENYNSSNIRINNNNNLAWVAGECPFDCEIYLYDGSTTSELSVESDFNESPQMNNDDDVVWSGRYSYTNSFEIFLYDSGSDAIVWHTDSGDTAGWDEYPDINDSGHVVWQAGDGHDDEIFLYDGSAIIQLTDNWHDDQYPKINNDGHVVWLSYAESDTEVYLSRPVTGAAEEWAVTYGGINDDRATSIQQTADGNYIVSGDTSSFGAGGIDFWVMRLDSSGDVLWEKSYGGAGGDYGATIQPLDAGGYVVCGRTESFGAGGGDIWALKLDENGDIVWEKTFGGSAADSVASIDEVSPGGGYVMAGRTESFGAGVKGDAWALGLDSDGNVEWQRKYGTVGGGEGAACIRQVGSGGFVGAGYTYSFGAGNGDFWVFNLSTGGGIIWEKTYGGTDIDRANDIQPTPGGGSIVVGDSYSFEVSGGAGYDVWVLKLDWLGNIEWQKAYGTAAWDYAHSVDVTWDGGYVVAGTTAPPGATAARDAWVMKLDADGNIVSQNIFRGPDFLSNDALVSIDRALDGGFIVGGSTEFVGVGGGDLWLLKLNENGEISGCSAMEPWTSTSIDTSVVAADTTAADEAISATTSDTTATVSDTTAVQGDGCEPVPADLIDLPWTGQTAGQSQHAGDDADLQMGAPWPSPRFTDNGDGTITDNLTGLMWLKDANCADTIGHDPDGTGDGSMQWESALDFVAGINDGTYTISAPHTDWRAPNINELESLANWGESDQATWLIAQGFTNVQSEWYWSSSTDTYQDYFAWCITMSNGHLNHRYKTPNVSHVWPVREGQQDYPDPSYPANVWKTGQIASYYAGDDGEHQLGVVLPDPRFRDNEDGTVTDNLTGLMWLKDAGCLGAGAWLNAFDTIADFNTTPGTYSCQDYTAGYADWRMPNRKEFYSLLDYSQTYQNPAFPAGHPFANIVSGWHWTSTAYAPTEGWAWAIEVGYGTVSYTAGSSGVLAVRGGTSADVPVISLYPTLLTNSCAHGENAPAQGLAVWNSGTDTVSYSISDNAEWLSCSPSSGTSTGEADSITVTYLTSYLSPGPYAAWITISDPGASNSPQYVAVALTVGPPAGLTQINCLSPANESVLGSAPTFAWMCVGGTNNRFAVDLSLDWTFSWYWSTYENLHQPISAESWAMPTALWNFIPSGSYIYWRVRGADLDVTPLSIVTGDDVWWFYKP
jgi:hypothetical protein